MILNTIIPMAEFEEESKNSFPRYLWQVDNNILLETVISSLISKKIKQRFLFMVSEQFEKKYHISGTIKQLVSNVEIIFIKNATAGALCTMLYGIDHFDENPCLVVSHDQILKNSIDQFIDFAQMNDCCASVMTFDGIHPKWSYVDMDEQKNVIKAVGNYPISREASTGIYYFRNTREFAENCMNFVQKYAGSEVPLYTNLVLNEYLLKGQKVMGHRIDNQFITFYKRDLENAQNQYHHPYGR